MARGYGIAIVLTAASVVACGPTPTPEGFIRVRAGSFTMGSPPGHENHLGNDTPHRVHLTRDFFLQAHEVTRREFTGLMGAVPAAWSPHGDDVPVTQVNWFEAVAYANARSRAEGLQECYRLTGARGTIGAGCREGQFGCGPGLLWPEWERDGYQIERVDFVGLDCPGYRLPSEAEWEYAAAAGESPTEIGARIDERAWHDGNADDPMPAATKAPNPWGLYDLLGNVWEQCWDVHGDGELGPDDAVDPLGPAVGENRVTKGASYMNGPAELEPARRIHGGAAGRNANIGFRLARSAAR